MLWIVEATAAYVLQTISHELKNGQEYTMGKLEVAHDDPSGEDHLDVERAVRERYSEASKMAEQSLCCPVEYDTKYLDILPTELIERDYGCGDPSRYLHSNETVLDLGSGGGKICYIAAQIVGAGGRVIGVDMNDDMLELARRFRQEIGNRIGYHNVDFYKARIQDLALDIERFEQYLQANPVQSTDQWWTAHSEAERMRREEPMIANDSIDVIVSNCVLNLVDVAAREQLFCEMLRVLRRGGRAVISDIVSDEPIPEHLKSDPKLWSGCISGAFVEDDFLAAFARAGFYGMEIVSRQEQPWATIEGIEFRSVTVSAYKGKDGPCLDHHQAVIYNGPWERVRDDDGHTLRRGQRTAVCAKTFEIYTRSPYAEHVTPVPPYTQVPDDLAVPYDCHRGDIRHPRETKGQQFKKTLLPVSDSCCQEECDC